MSGKSYDDYRGHVDRARCLFSDDEDTRRRAEAERASRIERARKEAPVKKASPRRPEAEVEHERYDYSLIRSSITRPAAGVERVYIVLVDNSGSNRVIAEHLKRSSDYLAVFMGAIDSQAQVAFLYFSDHCDGEGIRQDVDYIFPDEDGSRTLFSTTRNIFPAGGGDFPEAIECILNDVCDLNFGDAKERHLILVTDSVAHGMGCRGDNGCPLQRSWERSVERVRETFTTFEIVGCGDDHAIGDLQRKFLDPRRVAYDHIDLSSISEDVHRRAITGNAILFLVARGRGEQTAGMFLGMLYEKWLAEPLFGADTDRRAEEMIRRFGKYLELQDGEIDRMMKKVLS